MPAVRYRKKPVVIEAIEFTGDNTREVAAFIGADDPSQYVGDHDAIIIDTLEGPMRADLGDYVIRGIAGEHYPCKPDIFWKTYEAAS
jgi:hypothetical protein